MKRISYIISIIIILLGTGYRPVFAEEVTNENDKTFEVEDTDEEEDDSENEEAEEDDSENEEAEEDDSENEEADDDDSENEEAEEDDSENEEADDNEGDEEEKNEEEVGDKMIIISAINAGAKEFIELWNLQKEPIALSSLSVVYFNSKGNPTILYAFGEKDILVGESIVFRLAKTESAGNADFQYSGAGMSKDAGKVSVVVDDEEIDTVCWGKHPDCDDIKSIGEHTLVRNFETMEFSYQDDYEPEWEEGREVIVILDDDENSNESEEDNESNSEEDGSKEEEESSEPEEILPVCSGLEFSELFTYFINDKAEQFIELYNPTKDEINLDGCFLRYKNKSYLLDNEVQAGEFFVIFPDSFGFSLTKNPTKLNLIELIDADGSVVDTLEYYSGQKKGVSYAEFGLLEDGKENWEFTRILTPGEENKKEEEDKIEKKNEDEVSEPVCRGIHFSEILSFYETEKSEQFIEFYNPTATPISLNGCNIKYKNKYYSLYGTLLPEGYLVYFPRVAGSFCSGLCIYHA